MPGLIRQAVSATLAVLVASAPAPGAAQDGDAPGDGAPAASPRPVINVRAMRPDLPRSVVFYVADRAEGRQLDEKAAPDAATHTVDHYAALFCGRATNDYRAAFRIANKKDTTFPTDKPIGAADAYQLVWPACLYVSDAGGEHLVRKDEVAEAIYTTLTGSRGTLATQSKYFGRTQLKDLKPGEVLKYKWLTSTTPLRPKPGDDGRIDVQAFKDGFYEVLEPLDDVSEAYVRIGAELLKDPGDITPRVVTSADTVEADGSITPPADCKNAKPDLRPDAVRRAFAYSLGQRLPQVTNVLVVDNGFFGATYDAANDDLQVGAPFKGFVVESAKGWVGPVATLSGETFTPILDPTAVRPGPVSGHGTHVTGLTLGGAAFATDRTFLKVGAAPWLRVSVANIGAGGRFLPVEGVEGLDLLLDPTPSIVNFSLVFTKREKPRFLSFAKKWGDVLFVVAAGNDFGASVGAEQIYPAALGGQDSPNFITVAATAPNRQLASFSNVGQVAVDIAADGCALESWIDFGGTAAALSGTSQATPLVVLTAAMIRALKGEEKLTPVQIKSRILVSGDLLPAPAPFDERPIHSNSTLNMAKALFVNTDYIRFWDDKTLVTALGRLSAATGAGCGKDTPLKSLRAFKQQGGIALGFARRDVDADEPCAARLVAGDRVTFQIEAIVAPDGTITARTPDPVGNPPKKIQVEQVQEFVLRM